MFWACLTPSLVAFQWHHLISVCVCVCLPCSSSCVQHLCSKWIHFSFSLQLAGTRGIFTVYTSNLLPGGGGPCMYVCVLVCVFCVCVRTPTYVPTQQAPHTNAHSGQLLGSWWLVPHCGWPCLHINGCVWGGVRDRQTHTHTHICPLPDDTLLISNCFPLSSSLDHLERSPLYYHPSWWLVKTAVCINQGSLCLTSSLFLAHDQCAQGPEFRH